ncbi:MAG TPA: hypothetical protein PLS49_07005 [Candidatus Woesebacteria bacterium]|nr:hypothetical protein [Candidatus Woesebacteria bacterium]
MPKQKNEEEEPTTVPFLVYLKGFILIGAIIFGMFFLNRAAEYNNKQADISKSATLSSLSNFQESFTKENIQKTIDNEIRTNQMYKDTVDVIAGKRDEVLGEATKAAEIATEKAKDTFFDYVYEHTVGAVIKRVVEQMPEDQKEKLIEEVQR